MRVSQITQRVKSLPAVQETQKTQVWSLRWEDPLEEGMATHSGILDWRIPWAEEPGRLQSKGWQRSGYNWSDWAHAPWEIPSLTSSFDPIFPESHLSLPWFMNLLKNVFQDFSKKCILGDKCLEPWRTWKLLDALLAWHVMNVWLCEVLVWKAFSLKI